ncbi:piggyBac transposable element-derived protein 4-like [Penaeus vannamei]|uniref:piggyBac transposable element-derived protein 4-like n=1 Tax=Penaeus vannamei TaxID=6689 RepID=UPI00387FA998
MDFMQAGGFLDKRYMVYMDNWYTSPVLFHYLQGRKMSAVDTANINRQYIPKDLKPVQKGEVHFRSSGNGMLCLCWLDSKLVTMPSTVHTSRMVQARPQSRRMKPQCVVEYHSGMKGVDFRGSVSGFVPFSQKIA